ncbi:hypothetical protein HG530_007043 [Fusarium avenaceum]|nr:hypothetical protein HG530_007043 [Fusarium avenaceum]
MKPPSLSVKNWFGAAILSINVGRIGNTEAFVVTGSSLETSRIRVIGHHSIGGLHGEGLASRVEVGNVADESNSSVDGFCHDGSGSRGTSRGEDGHSNRLTLAQGMSRALGHVSSVECGGVKTALTGDSCAIDDSRAAGDGGNDSGERRHVEKGIGK